MWRFSKEGHYRSEYVTRISEKAEKVGAESYKVADDLLRGWEKNSVRRESCRGQAGRRFASTRWQRIGLG